MLADILFTIGGIIALLGFFLIINKIPWFAVLILGIELLIISCIFTETTNRFENEFLPLYNVASSDTSVCAACAHEINQELLKYQEQVKFGLIPEYVLDLPPINPCPS